MKQARASSILVALALLAPGVMAEAQPAKEKVPLIGFVTTGSQEANRPVIEPLRQRLRELGYVEGKTIDPEYRFADGQLERLPTLIKELSQLKIVILLANSGSGEPVSTTSRASSSPNSEATLSSSSSKV